MKKQQKRPISRAHTAPRHRLQALTWRQFYLIGACVVLAATTLYWSLLSAQVNLHNADQLVDPFLFEHGTTFQQAVFPNAHSSLLKWPVFALISLFGTNPVTIVTATIILSLVTVGAFAYVLSRINRRPLVLGTLYLALASMLLLVPTEPYPGALLPVNMAMLNTRNIEYIVYILALILLIRAPRLMHWKVGVATFCLLLLITSDKLFLVLSLGGAAAMLLVAYLRRDKTTRTIAWQWLGAGAAAGLLAAGMLWVINKSGFTHIGAAAESSQTGPYLLIHSAKDLVIGSIYAVMNTLTNLGANPAFDATIIKAIPLAVWHRLISIAGIGFIINFALSIVGFIAIGLLLRRKHDMPVGKKKKAKFKKDTSYLLALALIWTSFVALGAFIVTNHYYPVDARYLSIIIFAVFVALATYLRTPPKLTVRTFVSIGAVILVCGVGAGMVGNAQQTNRSADAYKQTAAQDSTIAATLEQHKVTTLIGDYWRVLPVKLHHPGQTVLPLSGCFTPRDNLSSHAWQPISKTSSFAYILSLKPSVTGFPACTINQVIATYGRPSSTQLISGTLAHPDELLLFYDYGKNQPTSLRYSPNHAILPYPISMVDNPGCATGRSIMNIVAHQDDDILFINPDTYLHLKAGDCIRSVYITAGDAGSSRLYWLSREEGSRAAYASMLGIRNPVWISHTVTLSDTTYATLSFLKNNPQVKLLFMHLPDGNPNGTGFPATNYESLARLQRGAIPLIHSVDDQSSYSSESLIKTLTTIMNVFHPDEIDTLAEFNHSQRHPDHSDHLTAAWYANQAYLSYLERNPDAVIHSYIGYPEQDEPANVFGNDLAATEAAFFAYSQHDHGTCKSVMTCSKMSYGSYLDRQYRER